MLSCPANALPTPVGILLNLTKKAAL